MLLVLAAGFFAARALFTHSGGGYASANFSPIAKAASTMEAFGNVDTFKFSVLRAPDSRFSRQIVWLKEEGAEVSKGELVAKFDASDIAFYLEQGIARVILGTSALKDRMFLEQALNRYADRIVVGIDCKDGYVQAQGWLESSDVYYLDFAKEMEKLNVKTIIVTDISKDGTLAGPNYEMLKKLKETVNIDIIASGGIKNIEHIKRLNSMRLYGAITGKAIYAKTLDLNEAWKICKEG